MKKENIYRKLFISIFLLSGSTFGGGYVIVLLMKKKFVNGLNWLSEEEMLNLIAVAQAAPGAVAVNAALLTGYKKAGAFGAAIGVVAAVLPPFIIISAISFFVSILDNEAAAAALKGAQAGVAAVIFNAALDFAFGALKQKKRIAAVIMAAAFVAAYLFKTGVFYIILFCAVLGALMGMADRNVEG